MHDRVFPDVAMDSFINVNIVCCHGAALTTSALARVYPFVCVFVRAYVRVHADLLDSTRAAARCGRWSAAATELRASAWVDNMLYNVLSLVRNIKAA